MKKFFLFTLFITSLIVLAPQQSFALNNPVVDIIEALFAPSSPAPSNIVPLENEEQKSNQQADLTPTHEVTASVKVAGKGSNTLQSVTVSSKGIAAGLIGRPRYSAESEDQSKLPTTEICIFDDKGSITKRWDLNITGQASSFSPDDKLYVAGEGKIAIYDLSGNLLKETALPHLEKIMGNQEILRQTAIDSWKEEQERNKEIAKYYENDLKEMKETIEVLEKKIADHKAKQAEEEKQAELEKQAEKDKPATESKEANSSETKSNKRGASKKSQLQRWVAELDASRQTIKQFEQIVKQFKYKESYTEEEIQAYIKTIPAKIGGVKSISITKDNIYVVTNASKGYGYVAWKVSSDLTESVVFNDKLSGCCSQVDLYACDKGIYMAENTKYRVGYYDFDGKLVNSYGKRARGKDEGFGGCCNPMNAVALTDGTVFCSESAGEIKRFNPDGTFASFVAKVKLPNDGCKNVSFAVNKDASKIYFADNVGSTLVILEPVSKKITQK